MSQQSLTLLTLAAAVALGGCAGARVDRAAVPADPSGPADTTMPAGPLPLTLAPRPTAPAISARDLMTRIYAFADDSMEGREAGTPGNVRGNEYIVRELQRLGLRPAGEEGGYLQAVPLTRRGFDPAGALTVDGQTFRAGVDVVPTQPVGAPRSVDGAQAVYGGALGDDAGLIDSARAVGKLVVLTVRPGTPTARLAVPDRLAGAAGVAVVALDDVPAATRAASLRPVIARGAAAANQAPARPTPLVLNVTRRAAAALLGLGAGAAIEAQPVGTAGRTVGGTVAYRQETAPSYNVVALLPGSDPALRAQYVALGAHNDHIGYAARAVDHDSLKAYNLAARRAYLSLDAEGDEVLTAEQTAEYRRRLAQIRVNVDSLRRLRPARRDSINNGADDDGSGSMGLLEIAENLAAMPVKPKRSVLFVWHTAEEKGLVGARWFADHPTVPRDSIVAQINIDMIGRGATADDQLRGRAGFTGVIGARRLSTELGNLLDEVNARQPVPLLLDPALDANGHPQNIYCRSDHAHYARYGIPIVFFFSGLHGDYHQPTDEPQYVHYANAARITGLVRDLTLRVANLAHRPVVDKPKPTDPTAPCQQ